MAKRIIDELTGTVNPTALLTVAGAQSLFAPLGAGSGTWGTIGGTLSSQSDLLAALNAKAALSHTHPQSDITGLIAALAAKESSITAGSTTQYWRGDKSFQTLDKTAVGLGNVDNTADASKPIFTTSVRGVAPASTNYLRADGTWAAPAGGGGGTVNSVSVTTANGVSGTVATSTTTPAITLALGAITPTSVAASGSVTGSNLSGTHAGTSSGTNTGDQTITLTGNVTGTGTGSFATTIAAGAVTMPKTNFGMVNVLDYGADPTNTTDSTTAIQNAINTGKTVFIPAGSYKLTGSLTMTTTYQKVIGDHTWPSLSQYTANTPIFVITTTTGSTLNEFPGISQLKLWAQVAPPFTAPSTSNAAIVVDGSISSLSNAVQRASITKLRLLGWGTGIYLKQHTNTLIEDVWMEHWTTWTGTFTSANRYVGIYFDGTPRVTGGISPQASVEVYRFKFNGGGAPTNVVAKGMFAQGADLRDIFLSDCETAGGDYGIHVISTGTSYNADIQIERPIIDGFKNVGILIEDLQGGQLTIRGGYCAATSTSSNPMVWVGNSTGINISNFQFVGTANNAGAGDDGLRINTSKGCSVTGCNFQNMNWGISVEGSSGNTITGNVFGAAVNAAESTPSLESAIRIFGTSLNNTIVGNVIRGASASYPYLNGIHIASGSTGNTLNANQVDTVTVTNPVVLLDNNNTVISHAMNSFRSNVTFGNTTTSSTASPLNLNLGGTYSSTAGANPKLKLFDDGVNVYGHGVSAGSLDVVATTGAAHNFYIGGTKYLGLTSTALTVTGNLVATNVSGTNTGDETSSGMLTKLAAASGGGTANFLRADGTWAAPAGSGSGTVNSVSVTTANGVSGSVATATTTPAITLTLGAVTPSSVAASGTIAGSNLSGTNTGDQTITLTGNVTGSGTGSFATTIASSAVTLAMLANMATGSLFYRKTAGSGAPEVQTLATLKTDLGLTGTNSGDQTTVTGNAGSATVLQTARNFSISGGGVTAPTVSFDGSGAVVLVPTLGAITPTTVTASGAIAASNFDTKLSAFCSGKPAASEVVAGAIAIVGHTITQANCVAKATVAATASTVFTIAKDGTTVGTITFAAAGTTATISITSGVITAAQNITITAPATPDTTLANISFLVRA